MGNKSAFGSIARKALGFLIVAFVAIFLFKLVVGAVAGFIQLLLRVRPRCSLVVGYAVVWAAPQAVIYLLLALWFGLATGLVGRVRGSSFFIWFVIGAVVPGDRAGRGARSTAPSSDEVRRQCPTCGKLVKLHDAMCMRCGTDLDFPEFAIEPESAAARR